MTIACTRCKRAIELASIPPHCQIFLCNSCALKWQEIAEKRKYKAYQTEVAQLLAKFISDPLS